MRRVCALLHAKSYVVDKRPSFGVVRKFEEGVPAQVSSSSSDRGSKLESPSQIRPRVALKRDVNITKLNSIYAEFRNELKGRNHFSVPVAKISDFKRYLRFNLAHNLKFKKCAEIRALISKTETLL
ncbi:hypothetical protein AVEN_9294-1 [Araneus ventricosus]|uniref:Uncharacterized protein n=1 Tax=Araneus ventricosus TaxID=182803 RepID=A0A4Y2KYY4_ARAVE|nr:hypothetical protein AVEN_9294-1 [Araneus ventricosus]